MTLRGAIMNKLRSLELGNYRFNREKIREAKEMGFRYSHLIICAWNYRKLCRLLKLPYSGVLHD